MLRYVERSNSPGIVTRWVIIAIGSHFLSRVGMRNSPWSSQRRSRQFHSNPSLQRLQYWPLARPGLMARTAGLSRKTVFATADDCRSSAESFAKRLVYCTRNFIDAVGARFVIPAQAGRISHVKVD